MAKYYGTKWVDIDNLHITGVKQKNLPVSPMSSARAGYLSSAIVRLEAVIMTTLQEPTTSTAAAQRSGVALTRAFNLTPGNIEHDSLVAGYVSGAWTFPSAPLSLLPASTELSEKRTWLQEWLRHVPERYRTTLVSTLNERVTYLNVMGGQLYVERD